MEKLLKLANELDAKGLQKEADIIDSFVKEAGALVTIAAWIAGKLSDETLVGIANELPSQRLAELAKKMDKEVLNLLHICANQYDSSLNLGGILGT